MGALLAHTTPPTTCFSCFGTLVRFRYFLDFREPTRMYTYLVWDSAGKLAQDLTARGGLDPDSVHVQNLETATQQPMP